MESLESSVWHRKYWPDRQYWLIIYNPRVHIQICRRFKVISFNTLNRQAKKLFHQMRRGDVALVKPSGVNEFTDVWGIASPARSNPNDSQPWATLGQLRGRVFDQIASIEVLEVFDPPIGLPQPITHVIGNKPFRPGIVQLSMGEFHRLYLMLTGKRCPY